MHEITGVVFAVLRTELNNIAAVDCTITPTNKESVICLVQG